MTLKHHARPAAQAVQGNSNNPATKPAILD